MGNHVVVLSGTFVGGTRGQMKRLYESRGFRVEDRITRSTSLLVTGEKPGSKLEQAENRGIMVLKEDVASKFLMADRLNDFIEGRLYKPERNSDWYKPELNSDLGQFEYLDQPKSKAAPKIPEGYGDF